MKKPSELFDTPQATGFDMVTRKKICRGCCWDVIEGRTQPEHTCGTTNNTREVEEASGTQQWTRRFLTVGTELGFGDLSMMVGVVSEILEAHTRNHHQELQKAREAERERILLAIARIGKIDFRLSDVLDAINQSELDQPKKLQNCIECGYPVPEYEEVSNCHGSCLPKELDQDNK